MNESREKTLPQNIEPLAPGPLGSQVEPKGNVLPTRGHYAKYTKRFVNDASLKKGDKTSDSFHGEFEGPEHQSIGDAAALVLPSRYQSWITNSGQQLTFGQTMALAGDFFGTPDSPISDGANFQEQQKRFIKAFQTLNEGETTVIKNILTIMQQQAAEVNRNAAQMQGRSDAYSKAYYDADVDYKYDKLFNGATGGHSDFNFWMKWNWGTYLKLANTNWDHFGQNAVTAYTVGHTTACNLAYQGYLASDQSMIASAYGMEAFACHYLSDLFSSGHLRTPRKVMTEAFIQLGSKTMHNEDSYNGLCVENINGDKWTAFGDKRYNDAVNLQNSQMAIRAVQSSIQDINNSAQGSVPAAFQSLNLIPNLLIVQDWNNDLNWSPLYIYSSEGVLKSREVWEDLVCYQWRSPTFSGYLYSVMPSTGVQSIFGTPPGGVLNDSVLNFMGSLSNAATPLLNSASAPAATLLSPQNMTQPDQHDNLAPVLHIVFRNPSDKSGHVLHNQMQMSDAPKFAGGAVQQIANQTGPSCLGGDPFIIACPPGLLLIYPDKDGNLYQVTFSAVTYTWSKSILVFASTKNPIQLMQGCRVALVSLGASVFLVFPDKHISLGKPNIWISRGALNTDGSYAFTTPGIIACTMPSDLNGVPVSTSQNVSAIEFNGTILLSYQVPTSKYAGSIPGVVVLELINPQSDPPTAFKFYDTVVNNANLVIAQTAMLLQFSNGWGVMGTSIVSSHGKTPPCLYFGYRQLDWEPNMEHIPSGNWSFSQGKLLTNYDCSLIFYNDYPYMIYSDNKNKNYLTVAANN